MASPPSSSSSSSEWQPHLPDDCWESIFKHLTNPHDHESLSLVSRHFLSLSNRLRTSLTVSDHLLPLLPALLRRFTSLTSIKLPLCINADIDALLSQIASFDLPSLHSLDISPQPTFPSHGLHQFSQKFPTLKSLNCSYTYDLDLVLIAECFSNLEEIDVSFSELRHDTLSEWDFQLKTLASGLKKLRKVNISGLGIASKGLWDSSIFALCQNCKFLKEIVALETFSTSKEGQIGLANAIRERPQLRSLAVSFERDNEVGSGNVALELIDALVSLKDLTCLQLSYSSISDEALCALADGVLPLRKLSLRQCSGYQYSGISCLLRKCNNLQYLDLQGTKFLNDERVIDLSLLLGNLKVVKLSGNRNLTDLSLFAIMLNCPLITEIRMDSTGVGKHKLQEDCLVVNSHVKFLYLASNSCLNDESVEMIASVCPNLEVIDLSYCKRVSMGAVEVLLRCCKIQRMDLARLGYPHELSQFQFRVNFQVPTLFVLNLSWCRISDEELSLISKNCYNLKELNLDYCHEITDNGVKQVVKNCKQLRMVSLDSCEKVSCDVAWMVFQRPSLRKIIPPKFYTSGIAFFWGRGYLLCPSDIHHRGRRNLRFWTEDYDYEYWGESLYLLE
ncbi:hypothetical protein PIB30_012703 [Stylosanthes scabra]|uniref:F-box domain-containing protein n=1 Tax=Stylosanthes scabra TaxID=79078 RepID=A0ABU6Q669_9FABA|nr:hypothetical protein [Stylosanthes scabra]